MSVAVAPFEHVLHGREELLADVLGGRDLLRHARFLLAAMLGGAAIYGAVLGTWRSPLLAVYVAIKLPLLLLVTALLTMLLNWMTAALLGVPLRLAQVTVLTLLVLATAAVVLASLAPVAWLFTAATPRPSPEARLTHNTLVLVHTLLVAAAGLAGTVSLWRILARLTRRPARVYLCWLAAFSLVGGEVAWLLRPFVGSVYQDVAFLRAESFQRNVYEFLFDDVIPALLRR